jgi:XTP/dITP diphosphohydrolase
MSRRLLLATRNPHKLIELRRILAPNVDVQVLGLDDVAPFEEVPESGATFAENALIKARAAYACTGLLTVADDSGLAVDALNGMPGVLSARWAGTAKRDTDNLRLVLEQLADTPDSRLGARFVCAAAMIAAPDEEVVTEGIMAGRLIREPRGSNGFGYDPIFVPNGYDITSAEMPSELKDSMSHRARALAALLPELLSALGV